MHNPSELLELARRIENGDTTEEMLQSDAVAERLNGVTLKIGDTFDVELPETVERDVIEFYERDMIVAALRRFAVERETEINAERFLNG